MMTESDSAEVACTQALQAASQQAPVQPCSQLWPVSVALSCCCISASVSAAGMSIWWQGGVLSSVAAGIEMAHAPRNGATASARAIMIRNHLCGRVCIVYKGSPVNCMESSPVILQRHSLPIIDPHQARQFSVITGVQSDPASSTTFFPYNHM
jgi:hypothetical protein